MHERIDAFLDDPAKMSGVVTVGTLAVFGVLHETMDPEHVTMVRVLGSLDFAFNAVCWYRNARYGQGGGVSAEEEASASGLFLDEPA